MTLQEQLRKLTTGGPGVTHIATETLFEDAATALDAHDRIIQSWKREEAEWIAERDALAADKADDLRRMAHDANTIHALQSRVQALEAVLRMVDEYFTALGWSGKREYLADAVDKVLKPTQPMERSASETQGEDRGG